MKNIYKPCKNRKFNKSNSLEKRMQLSDLEIKKANSLRRKSKIGK